MCRALLSLIANISHGSHSWLGEDQQPTQWAVRPAPPSPFRRSLSTDPPRVRRAGGSGQPRGFEELGDKQELVTPKDKELDLGGRELLVRVGDRVRALTPHRTMPMPARKEARAWRERAGGGRGTWRSPGLASSPTRASIVRASNQLASDPDRHAGSGPWDGAPPAPGKHPPGPAQRDSISQGRKNHLSPASCQQPLKRAPL